MSETLYVDQQQGLTLTLQRAWPADARTLVARTVWGSTGLRYRVHDSDAQLDRAPDAWCLCLRQGEALVGAYGLVPRTVRVEERTIEAQCRVYLAVAPRHTGRGLGRILVEQARLHFLDQAPTSRVLYGTIEEDNASSLALARRVRYEPIGTLHGLLFGRLQPRRRVTVEAPGDGDEIRSLLRAYHADHALFDNGASLDLERYRVVRSDGRIVAGVQVEHRHWTVVDLGGIYGRIVLALLPRLPGLRRFLDGDRFDHLDLGNFYVAPGCEQALVELLETLLVETGLHVALSLLDAASPLCAWLEGSGALGTLHRVVGPSPVLVMAGWHRDLPTSVAADLRRRPLYVNPNDPN